MVAVSLRVGEPRDTKAIIDFAIEEHGETSYADIPIDKETLRSTILTACVDRKSKLWVVEDDGEICGFMIGCVSDLFFTKKKVVTDMVTLARKGGNLLIDAFLEWAKTKGAARIWIQASNAKDADLFGVLLERKGLRKVGGLYECDQEGI